MLSCPIRYGSDNLLVRIVSNINAFLKQIAHCSVDPRCPSQDLASDNTD